VGLGWHAEAPPSSLVPAHAGTRRPRGQPQRRGRGQSKRPLRLKRGACVDPVGYDAGKKVKGVKYQIVVDTLGLLLNVVAHSADIQDRDGIALVLDRKMRQTFPFIEVIYADGGYQGDKAAVALAAVGDWQLVIVKRSDPAKGFVVLPKRWVVERTLSWLSRCRRLVRNHELYHRTAVAFIQLAMIRLMLRRLCTQ
jgi:transposase